MKTKTIVLVVLIIISGCSTLCAQGFYSPQQGKAVVYFVRVTNSAYVTTFKYFHNDKYIGEFYGKNYLRYECEPGKHLIWASSGNKEFITAQLKEGGTYVVIVDVIPMFINSNVGLSPISCNDTVLFQRAKEVISNKKPIVVSGVIIEKTNMKPESSISKSLKMYDSDWKTTSNFKHILAEMAIPQNAMQ